MSREDSQRALQYHKRERPGKTEVIPSKPIGTPEEFALAYSPGALFPTKGIAKNRWNAYKYTNKGNLVAIVSDGSSVANLGNTGALATKHMMEGISMLLKTYADIDAFDIEIAENDIDKIVEIIHAMAATFGAISLDYISAPRCMEIESRLKLILDIPVMHNEQHASAVIICAAFINAAEIAGKEIGSMRIVIDGVDTSTLSTVNLLLKLGVREEDIVIIDNKDLFPISRSYLSDEIYDIISRNSLEISINEALNGADLLLESTEGHHINKEALDKMAASPIIFLLSATTSIDYYSTIKWRPDAIVASRENTAPNQIENILASPYLFRGALDSYATVINESMLLSAVRSIAMLARQKAPASIEKMYHRKLSYGKEYILPKLGDKRLLTEVSAAVAQAAIDSGIARRYISNWKVYRDVLLSRMERGNHFRSHILHTGRDGNGLHRRYIRGIPEF